MKLSTTERSSFYNECPQSAIISIIIEIITIIAIIIICYVFSLHRLLGARGIKHPGCTCVYLSP